MNKRLSLKIARRMNTLLSEQLGEGVNPQRMLDDPLYARDVLLVSDAMDDSELRKLARMFRQAMAEPDDAPIAREPMSISSMLNSIFGHHHEHHEHRHEPGPGVEPEADRSGQVSWARRLFKVGDRGASPAK